jgi:hypothetical protein
MKLLNSFIIIALLPLLSSAQNYKVDWHVIGSGGGHSQSANYQVDGTIGQPIVGHASSPNYQVDAGFWVGAVASAPPCNYVIGDISGNGMREGADVTYGVRYLKGSSTNIPGDSCYGDSVNTVRGHWLYVAFDVNGDCNQSGADITKLVGYFKGTVHLSCCHLFPTALPPFLREQSGKPMTQE